MLPPDDDVCASPLPGLIRQGQRRNAGGDIETGIAFDAERLQRDRLVGAADQHIRADSDDRRRARGDAAKGSGERAGCRRGGWCKYRPNQHTASRKADIDAKLVDRPDIVLRGASSHRCEVAIDRPRRAEDEAEAAGDVAGERASSYALRLHRGLHRHNAGHEAERADRYREFLEHSVSLLLATFRWSRCETSTFGHIAWFRAQAPWFPHLTFHGFIPAPLNVSLIGCRTPCSC